MAPVWTRLIQFETSDGRIVNGEPILPSEGFDLGNVKESDGLKAKVVKGSDLFATDGSTTVTNETVTVKRLVGPLSASQVPIIRCVGLNYAKHSELDDLMI